MGESGAPRRTRTSNLLIRSQVLYPIELGVQRAVNVLMAATIADRVVGSYAEKNGAPRRIRTPNLLIRSQVLYPIELGVHRSAAGLVAARFAGGRNVVERQAARKSQPQRES